MAALAAGLLVLCWVLGARPLARAAVGPAVGAGVALLGLVPSLRATAPARPVIAAVAVATGLVLAALMQRAAGRAVVLPIAGAALVAVLLVIYRTAQFHGAIRMLTHTRFTLASSARSGEAAAALHIVERHPLAGVAPGHATLRWTSPGGGLNVDRYAHNEYLQVLTDLGIAGAALAAIFMAAAWRLLWRARAALPGRALWAGAVAAGTAFLLHSGFDFLWQVPAIPLTVAAIVGLAIHQPPARRHEPPGGPHNEERSWNAASHQG
jgi:O-antigen ligase